MNSVAFAQRIGTCSKTEGLPPPLEGRDTTATTSLNSFNLPKVCVTKFNPADITQAPMVLELLKELIEPELYKWLKGKFATLEGEKAQLSGGETNFARCIMEHDLKALDQNARFYEGVGKPIGPSMFEDNRALQASLQEYVGIAAACTGMESWRGKLLFDRKGQFDGCQELAASDAMIDPKSFPMRQAVNTFYKQVIQKELVNTFPRPEKLSQAGFSVLKGLMLPWVMTFKEEKGIEAFCRGTYDGEAYRQIFRTIETWSPEKGPDLPKLSIAARYQRPENKISLVTRVSNALSNFCRNRSDEALARRAAKKVIKEEIEEHIPGQGMAARFRRSIAEMWENNKHRLSALQRPAKWVTGAYFVTIVSAGIVGGAGSGLYGFIKLLEGNWNALLLAAGVVVAAGRMMCLLDGFLSAGGDARDVEAKEVFKELREKRAFHFWNLIDLLLLTPTLCASGLCRLERKLGALKETDYIKTLQAIRKELAKNPGYREKLIAEKS